ncbi:4-hydroxythreonine-4-phosphate dehydrogenase PdxA [Pseudahrensia aquimaris]|uniref:4-hydroxythreonine-4-phosphate dehydrogenase n=1 Tax=Pseudahrensia aquimaris TaxID=744461 RepID=A0ABW3FFT2_9HYPH
MGAQPSLQRGNHNQARLCVSLGDPAGIGPEILLKTWAMAADGAIEVPSFFVLGDVDLLNDRAQLLGMSARASAWADGALPADSLPVLQVNNPLSSKPGKPEPKDAAGVVEAIERGVALIREGRASGLVTLPINKKHLYDAGFEFPGHTEYLAALATGWHGNSADAPRSVMMLAGPDLRTVPVTVHIPLENVKAALTADLIVETARIVNADLQSRFAIAKPRLAFAGLNPHAGEDGALGTEEMTVLEPALAVLRSEGVECIGPLPADTMFHARARQAYDVALCMYHDQALIPAKALAFDESVNVTLGLPFIRTSPDHGTAYDIAGTGKADPSSFIAALKMAGDLAAAAAQATVTAA